MLRDRITYLKFDDHTLEAININNGIGQGDPLSMVLYQFYNADILDIPRGKAESAIGYVDDALILAVAKNFTKMHDMLTNMLTREGGIYEWSNTYNSPLKLSKLTLIDFAHRTKQIDRPPLTVAGSTFTPMDSFKYLGIMVDQHLTWKTQYNHTIKKGSKWASQIRRLTRPSWGITPRYTHHLYIGVALLRILCGADIWCGPPSPTYYGPKSTGTCKVLRQLTTIQRSSAIAITGALCSAPTSSLNICAFLLPAILTVEKWCLCAATHLTAVLPKHPLYKQVRTSISCGTMHHSTPIQILFANFTHDPKLIKKKPTKSQNPAQRGLLPFVTNIPPTKEASVREAM